MATTQITLTESESEILQVMSRRTGKAQDELLHEAVKNLIAQFEQQDRRAALRRARGIWRERNDLPALHDLRNELNRS